MQYTHREIAEAMGGKILTGDPSKIVTGYGHDSRKVAAGDLFFAIVGENVDGHRFIPGAMENGCASFVISEESVARELMEGSMKGPSGEIVMAPEDLCLILVEDTLTALTELAAHRLRAMDIQVVGITGSTGKTTTRDMTAKVMATKHKVGVPKGNLNTDIGMSMTILGFEDDTEVAVLEMAMDKRWEIDRLCQIAPPHVALITNVGVTHIENLGSRDEIFRAKMEITTRLKPDDWLIVNKGDYLNHSLDTDAYQLLLSGADSDCAVRLTEIEDGPDGVCFTIAMDGETARVELPVPGHHNAFNAALALAAGKVMGISLAEGAEGLKGLELTGARLKMEEHGGVILINDTYNASPDSMTAALDILARTGEGRRFAVLADMRELGPVSEEMHRKIGAYAAEKGLAGIFAFGPECVYLVESAGGNAKHYENEEEALRLLCSDLLEMVRPGDTILFKGSRGMQVERVLEDLKSRDIRER